MFNQLKSKNRRTSHYENRPNAMSFSKVPNADSTVTKGNESERLVRCRVCGFPCDLERDVNLKDGSYAGFGINQGAQKTMGSTVGDNKTPAAGSVSGTAQGYYDRVVSAGCPACASYIYNPRQRVTRIP